MQRTAKDQTTTELVQFLSNPASYPARPEVELIETHISFVFLAGGDVYKLKKPVKFDFLDFATVTKRKKACEEELRLNRRMAPSVYLDVLPIRRKANGSLTLGGSEREEVVDWVVHMRRLDSDRTLASRFGDAQPDELATEILQVAQFLAKFFAAQAPAMVRTDTFHRRLREHIEENQFQLHEMVTSEAERDQVRLIHSSQLRFLLTHRDLIDSRVLDGRIVDGHGDLRPDHIYILKSPLIIDCIEFNSEYRANDVIDELAFLTVCSDRVGQSIVGKLLFSEYEKASCDQCHPQLIDFYKSYRACVRAKVAGICANQQTSQMADDSLDTEHAYLDLASRYVQSLGPPLVLIMGGLMGSGKSTLARELKQRLSAELISSDAIRNAESDSAAVSDEGTYGEGQYSLASRMNVYERMIEVGGRMTRRNRAIIFDGTFTKTKQRRMVVEFATSIGAKTLQIECKCPREEAIARVNERARRGNSLSEALPEHYDQQVAESEPLLDDIPSLRIDATLGLAEEQAAVLERVLPLLKS